MKRWSFLIIASVMAVSVLSCSKGPRLIPLGKLSKIYEEMFISDKWLNRDGKSRAISDTALVYDPIFKKYGYTYEDFAYSISKYMDDPGKYDKMVDKLNSSMEKRKKRVASANVKKRAEQQRKEENRAPESGFPKYYGHDYSAVRTDTIEFVRDTVGSCDIMRPRFWPPVRSFDTLVQNLGKGYLEIIPDKEELEALARERIRELNKELAKDR